MKNLINKVRHHGKRMTIYLKSQPKWIARCMFGIGAILGLGLSLHARTIGGTNADGIECPTGQQLATGDVCITNEKDIVIQATATESDQTLTINKYFANDYTVDRGDGNPIESVTTEIIHTYSEVGTYNIILSLTGGATRRSFTSRITLVPQSGTTMDGVIISYMPSLADGFGISETNPGDSFFHGFNYNGALTSLPEGSFDTSNITTVGDGFFEFFNYSGALTSLPEGSFDTNKITTVGNRFFQGFNTNGVLMSLPEGSFKTDKITTVGNFFFASFNSNGALTSLPEGSFDTSNITTAGRNFFHFFNSNGALINLPEGSFKTDTITTAGYDFFCNFNHSGALTSLPEGSFDISNITTVEDNFFAGFNYNGALTSLPEGSFDTNKITTAGGSFFASFNYNGALTSLPNNSFDISNITTVSDNFFYYFNSKGDLTSLPEGSFDISNITTVEDNFFAGFNYNGALTSLPNNSFDISNITTVSDNFFYYFNSKGNLTSLPEGSFDISNITTVEDNFFAGFNYNGALTSLPEGSFDTNSITTAGRGFFGFFNYDGKLKNLPDSFTLNSLGSQSVGGYQSAFNSQDYTLNKNVSDLVSGVTAPLDDRNVFSDNQPGRCGVHEYWLDTKAKACSITYNSNGGSEIANHTKKYEANTTGIVAGDGIETPTRTGYTFSGRYTTEQGGDLVDIVVFPNMDGGTLYAQWIDTTPPNCDVAYSTTGPTNQDVIATLTGCSEPVTVTNNDDSMEYTFENIGTFNFEFQDLAGNTGIELAAVTWIDKDIPSCDVTYSTTGATTGNVTATLTCEEEDDGDITVTNNSGNMEYTFENTGTFTFEFQDLAGNTGSADAVVTWIDKTKPTCDVIYSTTGATTGNVTATLTGCSGTITGTNLQHTFTGNGTYTFNFQDLLGNTGEATATVTWIISGNNIVYFDTEGNEFIWNDLTICNPNKSGECITMMDRNLGATTNDVSKTGSYGYYYQWGNNYGFNANSLNAKVGQVDVSTYGPTNQYNSGVFLYGYTNRYSGGNDNLRGGSGDSYNNYRGWDNRYATIENRQGPCPQGYHVPSIGERNQLFYYWYNSLDTQYGVLSTNYSLYQLTDQEGKIGKMITEDFYIPTAGNIITNRRQPNNTGEFIPYLVGLVSTGMTAGVWSSTPFGRYDRGGTHGHFRAFSMNMYGNKDTISVGVSGIGGSEGLPIRCFKNSPETGNIFSISFDNDIKPGEYATFTVRAMKDGQIFNNYTGTVIFTLTNKSGGLVNKKNYTLSNSGRYTFELNDGGKKVFYSGLKINQSGTYILTVNGVNDGFKGSVTIKAGVSHQSAEFKYDTLKFNPNYSDEMNEAYQYARYFDITTKNSIKDADMYSGLNRIAMAKMLTNYAENVLGKSNFNTGRNCTFKDVSTSLDKDYDYGVSKACQLGIMGVNMPDNRFYPNGGVTRAEFATALSRLLYNTKDGTERYYSTHITKLRREGIITNTDPALWELRGYVMLMLKRVAEK